MELEYGQNDKQNDPNQMNQNEQQQEQPVVQQQEQPVVQQQEQTPLQQAIQQAQNQQTQNQQQAPRYQQPYQQGQNQAYGQQQYRQPNYNQQYYGQQTTGQNKGYQQYGTYQQSSYQQGNYGQGTYQQAPNNRNSGSQKGNGKNEKPQKGKGNVAAIIALVLVAALLVSLIGGFIGVSIAKRVIKGTEAVEKIEDTLEETLDDVDEDDVSDKMDETLEEITGASDSIAETGSASARTVAEIAAIGMPSVVAITNQGEKEVRSFFGTYVQEAVSSGSGVIIGQSDEELLIVTNYHVIEDSDELSVVFSYQEDYDNTEDIDVIPATVKDYDAGKDLAVIALKLSDLSQDNMDHIAIATIGDSDKLVLGEQVVAIGNALGYGQSVTEGVVSALSRTVTMTSAAGIYISNDYLQVDAAINPGNSGGALYNMYGELVGINSAKVSSAGVEGMGYSIPITAVIEELNGMMNSEAREVLPEEERGYLGIQGSNVTSGISSEYNLPIGAYISSVNADSPAEKAGLEKGMIITGMNEKKVTGMNDLKDQLSRFRPDETVTLKVQVFDEEAEVYNEKEFSVTLASYESVGFDEMPEEQPEEQKSVTLEDILNLFR